MLLLQNCVCVVALYPFRIEPLEDFDPIGDLDVTGEGDVWYARPLLFFTCTLCPTGHGRYNLTQGRFTGLLQDL
jgi:hypothetical protein